MSLIRICQLTRELIEAAGGVVAAGHICRLSAAQMSRCTIPDSGVTLNIRALDELERHVGRRIVTGALAQDRLGMDHAHPLQSAAEEASDATEMMAALQAFIRKMPATMSANQRREALAMLSRVQQEVSDVVIVLTKEQAR